MFSKCERPIDEMLARALHELGEFLQTEIKTDDVSHTRFVKRYSNSAGPFTSPGMCSMQAFWDYEMDAFIINCRSRPGGQNKNVAAVFAAGRFWSIVELTITMQDIETDATT